MKFKTLFISLHLFILLSEINNTNANNTEIEIIETTIEYIKDNYPSEYKYFENVKTIDNIPSKGQEALAAAMFKRLIDGKFKGYETTQFQKFIKTVIYILKDNNELKEFRKILKSKINCTSPFELYTTLKKFADLIPERFRSIMEDEEYGMFQLYGAISRSMKYS